jgi:hypothetical protein
MSATAIRANAQRYQGGMRYILVNHRVPCGDQRCAHCGAGIKNGYVRDFQTNLLCCDAQCLAERPGMQTLPSRIA